MKHVLLTFALLSVPSLVLADFGHARGSRALQVAVQVENTLTQISSEAMEQADIAVNRNPLLVEQLDDVSDEANHLARIVHRSVLRPLKAGTPEEHVAYALTEIEEHRFHLERGIETLNFSNPGLQRQLQTLNQNLGQLRSALQTQATPLTASCTVKTGGNFFVPKSHVECTIYGRGAVGYEAVLAGRAKVHGSLQPHLATQTLVSEKVKVGYDPAFEIYLITRSGDRILVAQN